MYKSIVTVFVQCFIIAVFTLIKLFERPVTSLGNKNLLFISKLGTPILCLTQDYLELLTKNC